MWVSVAILLAGLIGFMVWSERAGEGVTQVATTTPSTVGTSTTIQTSVGGITANGNYKIEVIPNTPSVPAPSFRAPIVFASSVATNVKDVIQQNANIYIERIAKDKTDLKSWIDLGTMHKMAGDYTGAEIIWAYIAKVAPQNSIAVLNLADLYANFKIDYKKAEANYVKAMTLAPNDTSIYANLFGLYNGPYKASVATAESTLKKGIAANPLATDLKVLLARYYKSMGKAAEAKAEFSAAAQSAKDQGQTDLAVQITAEGAQL